jgi:drug/metabolite transporter (DMT)-like permease
MVSNWWPGGERLTWARIGAVLIGFLGVGVLVGPTAIFAGGTNLYLLGVLACLIGSSSYALGSLFAHKLLVGLPLMQQAIGQIGMGAVILAPIAGISLAIQPPTHLPSFWPIASVLALSLGGTTIAYICYFWLIKHVGPTRTLIVTYLLPCMALVYGALLLHEIININAIAGLALVMAGIFLTGRTGRKTTVEPNQASISQQEI